ncbi:MAG: hypothetical protein IPN53_23205 [Comamonadaceae bacterium]|nr:hypothetical protein [Comamonadaceae bacterium]
MAIGVYPGATVIRPQWLGLLLDFVGVEFVVFGKIGTGFGVAALLPAIMALAGITVGSCARSDAVPSLNGEPARWRNFCQ